MYDWLVRVQTSGLYKYGNHLDTRVPRGRRYTAILISFLAFGLPVGPMGAVVRKMAGYILLHLFDGRIAWSVPSSAQALEPAAGACCQSSRTVSRSAWLGRGAVASRRSAREIRFWVCSGAMI